MRQVRRLRQQLVVSKVGEIAYIVAIPIGLQVASGIVEPLAVILGGAADHDDTAGTRLKPPGELESPGEIVVRHHPDGVVEPRRLARLARRDARHDDRRVGSDDLAILQHERDRAATERDQNRRRSLRIFSLQVSHGAVDLRLARESLELHVVDEDFEALGGFFGKPPLECIDRADGGRLGGRQAFEKIDPAPLLVARRRRRDAAEHHKGTSGEPRRNDAARAACRGLMVRRHTVSVLTHHAVTF